MENNVSSSDNDVAVAEKVHFALRLARLQTHPPVYDSDVDEDVMLFLKQTAGITDIYNVPKKWTEVRWRGKPYLLCELEDEDGIVTPFGLYLDWPAPTPDIKDDPDWDREPELP